MNRILPFLGVLALLVISKTEANGRNTREFWNLWGTDEKKPDFYLENKEDGSGILVDGNFGDDEDFEVGSGDNNRGNNAYPDNNEDDTEVDEKSDMKMSTDDEDELDEESGSGIIPVEEEVVEEEIELVENKNVGNVQPTTTAKALTPCQNLRNSAIDVAQYIPECDTDGNFKHLQCKADKFCWCVDPKGVEIPGTRMKHPNEPDCDFGSNLPTCVFQLVQNSQELLGAYKPNCTSEGQYTPVQCKERECWCVDLNGNEMLGTIKTWPQTPDCSFTTTTTVKTVELPKAEVDNTNVNSGGYNVPEEPTNVNVVIKPEKDEKDREEVEEETNSVGGLNEEERYQPVEKQAILAQPGLLAAIIGSAVVGLLCMVLLVMFIVYRMRKKDEGSYPLDEQKFQNYSYSRAPKEFYA